MNVVGEWVGRDPAGLSAPRGERAPPTTFTPGDAALISSYVSASSARYAGAAAFDPSRANCGSQKRFRLGSFPTMTSRTAGTARTSAVAYDANSTRAASVSGVVRELRCIT